MEAKELRVVTEERLGNMPGSVVWYLSYNNLNWRPVEPTRC
jgi:hypothetical protein